MTYDQALYRLTSLCSKAEYCSHDVSEKMSRWELAEADKERLLAYLIEERYIDDARFARLYAGDKLRFNHWGKIKIAVMLRQKQIGGEAINEALDNLDEGEYTDILSSLLREKARSVVAKNEFELAQKLIKFAQSRGFAYEDIRHCLP